MSKVSGVEKEARKALITGAKRATVCRICHSPIIAGYSGGNAAHRGIELRCPKHGVLKEGDRYMTGYRVVFGDDGGDDE